MPSVEELDALTEELKEETVKEENEDDYFSSLIKLDLLQNIDMKKFNTIDEYKEYKNFMYKAIRREIDFKGKVRIYSLIALSLVALLMIINIFVMMYLPDVKVFKLTIPQFDNTIILAMITATFVNLFTIITLVFKYIFSPTSDLMNHTKDMNEN